VDAAVSRRFRNAARLLDHGRTALRADALRIAAAALDAVDPPTALRRIVTVEDDELVVRGRPWLGLQPPAESGATAEPDDARIGLGGRRVFLIGAGKASVGVAAVLDELLGPRLADAAVVVKRGQAAMLPRPLRYIELLEAQHPVPDETSLAGGLRLLDVARQTRSGDLLVAIVTGGSSSLAVAPAAGITLEDKIETNRVLLACGADIVAINNVRKHLSAIKGGLLAQACGAAAGEPASCEVVNFTVSDVVGDPLDYVTDLTVPDRSTWRAAQETCDRYGLWDRLPSAVVERLRRADPAEETPKDLPAVSTWVVADADQMCAAAARQARRLGYVPHLLGLDWEGEAREAGAVIARRLRASPPGSCLLAGGENTVTLTASPPVGENGSVTPTTSFSPGGGPSQEAALAAALGLAGQTEQGAGAVVLCMDSDGTDGPTDAAGGLVDDRTAVGSAAGRLAEAVTTHTAHDALQKTGDLVVTGPTGTNVNDLRIALSARPR
jgi:hydroxypyruvate reductase/glycerate 2-kinase